MKFATIDGLVNQGLVYVIDWGRMFEIEQFCPSSNSKVRKPIKLILEFKQLISLLINVYWNFRLTGTVLSNCKLYLNLVHLKVTSAAIWLNLLSRS